EMAVVNISLAFNWMSNAGLDPRRPGQDAASARNTVRNDGSIVRSILDLPGARDMVFVSAAGNDSRPSSAPDVEAQWASPLNWAALNAGGFNTPAPNVIVVEAIDREGRRADFSNLGGHISAPGVGILSTTTDGYGVMRGTSMAAPHVSALVAMLFSYNPELTAAEAVRLVVNTARPSPDRAAPHVDALEALLRSSNQALVDLADLNADGAVDEADYEILEQDWSLLQAGGASFTRDLNGDGIVNGLETAWPMIDLNGSGTASSDPQDRRLVLGRLMSDLDVLRNAWTDDALMFSEASGQTEEPSISDAGGDPENPMITGQ
ncbi:MAG TPA: S8 family serine peptidase, partial [Arenibaculum sp.]|nr:S8 family serine peptidase [Arenibaculum sp.]